MKNKKGFTLIEIMIVVVIIGILASMALPRLGNQVKKASAAEALSLLGSIARAAMQCYVMQDEDVTQCTSLKNIGDNTGATFATETASFIYTPKAAGDVVTFEAAYKAVKTGESANIYLTIDLASGNMAKCSDDPVFQQLRGVDPANSGVCNLTTTTTP